MRARRSVRPLKPLSSAGTRQAGRGKRPRRRHVSRFPLHAIYIALIAAACGGPAETTVYVGATAWDGTGAPPILDAVIVVRGDRIVDIGPPGLVSIPADAVEQRLDGRFVVPGLIDLHTHAPRWAMTRYLAYGVTAIRHLSGPSDSVLALRNDLDLASVRGPRMFAAGQMIDGSPPLVPYAFAVSSAEEARRAVGSLVLSDMSWAKAHTKITRSLLQPLLDEARTLNLPVAAHLGKVDALTAGRMGVRTIEHLSGVAAVASEEADRIYAAYDNFAQGFRTEELTWAEFDSARVDQVARLLAATGVGIVPTLVTHELVSRLDNAGYLAAIDNSGVPGEIRRAYAPGNVMQQFGLTNLDLVLLRTARDRQDLFVRRFIAAGGIVGAGTDSPSALIPPGASLHQELALLVSAGLSTERALLTATRDAARLLGQEGEIGTLQPGHAADFVVLEADPLAAIGNLGTIHTVVSRGTEYRPSALRREWRP